MLEAKENLGSMGSMPLSCCFGCGKPIFDRSERYINVMSMNGNKKEDKREPFYILGGGLLQHCCVELAPFSLNIFANDVSEYICKLLLSSIVNLIQLPLPFPLEEKIHFQTTYRSK